METIKSSADITRLFNMGKRVNTPELSLIIARIEGQHDQHGRVAFIAGKKLGNAVWRNRAKRRMRAICREVGGPFEGYEVAFVARKRMADEKYETVVNHVKKSLVQSGILE